MGVMYNICGEEGVRKRERKMDWQRTGGCAWM